MRLLTAVSLVRVQQGEPQNSISSWNAVFLFHFNPWTERGMKCRNKVLHDNAANIVTLTRIVRYDRWHANCIQRVKWVQYLTAYRIYALRHHTQLMFCRSCNSTIGLFEWLLLLSQFVLAALLRDSSRWDGLLWGTPSQTGLPAACCSCSRLQTCSFPAKSRHWLQFLFTMPVPVSLLWQQRFGKRWWPSWRLPEIQTGMQAAVDA